jgi:PAS domain S-box-containing protein
MAVIPSFRESRRAAIGVAVVGIALALGLAIRQAGDNARLYETRLQASGERIANQLVERLRIYEYGLRAVRGVTAATDPERVTAESFRRYSEMRDLDLEFPGARGFGVIRRVPEADEAAYLQRMRAQIPDFAIRTLEAHGGERYVIELIEPIARNREARGLDIASENNRRTAANQAIYSGRATLTGPITLVQAAQLNQRSFLLLLPAWRESAAIDTPEQRSAAAWGWSYVPIVIDEVLQGFDALGQDFALELVDITGTEAEGFYRSPALADARIAGAPVALTRELFGRKWRLVVHPRPVFVAALRLPNPVSQFVLGAAIAVLLAGFVHALAQSRQRALQIRNERARFGLILENASDAIIGQGADGLVESWNRAAERIFGYPAAEAIGRPLQTLIVPPERQAEALSLLERAVRGESVRLDTVCCRRDGSLVDVSIAAARANDTKGELTGVGQIIRDISDRKVAERELSAFNDELQRQVTARTEQLESARRFSHTILDAIPMTISYWDRQYRCRFANRALRVAAGRPEESFEGRTLRDLYGEQIATEMEPYFEAALRGERQQHESRFSANAASEGHYRASYVPDADGAVVQGLTVIGLDVSAEAACRRRLATMLQENAALLRAIDSFAALSVTDPHGRIVEVNDAFCALYGYERADLLGQDHRLINAGLHTAGFFEAIWRTVLTGNIWRGEISNRARAGELRRVDCVIAPILREDGTLDRILSIQRTIVRPEQGDPD